MSWGEKQAWDSPQEPQLEWGRGETESAKETKKGQPQEQGDLGGGPVGQGGVLGVALEG